MKLILLAVVACATLINGSQNVNRETYDNLLSTFGSRLFSRTCDADMTKMSPFLQCWWPHGDLREAMVNFLKDAKSVGCKVPPRYLVKAALDYLSTEDGKKYGNHPLYAKIPSEKCGRCPRKAKCCTMARSFLTQAFESEPCDNDWNACKVTPLNEADITRLAEIYPTVTPAEDRCDFSPWVDHELNLLHNGPVFPFAERPLCQLLGTTRPNFSCVTVNSMCRCCCFGYRYSAEEGQCVVDETAQLTGCEPKEDDE